MAGEPNLQAFIKIISEKIASLKEAYPQLKEFSTEKHVDIEHLKIDYDYHTHDPQHSGGWTSGVPNPYPDGIWLYIDLHDDGSTAQIHTQPITERTYTFGEKKIGFLILEGSETKSISDEIISIFEQSGAKSGQP